MDCNLVSQLLRMKMKESEKDFGENRDASEKREEEEEEEERERERNRKRDKRRAKRRAKSRKIEGSERER